MALEKLGLAFVYLPFSVPPSQLKIVLLGLRALPYFMGANVTIPHKEAVLKQCDTLDAASRALGAVNVVVREQAGKLKGHNTDWLGFLDALKGEKVLLKKGAPALVMGAGGGARAVVYALLSKGVAVRVFNRHHERARRLAHDFSKMGKVKVLMEDELLPSVQEARLIVNATSRGMVPHRKSSPFDNIGLGNVRFRRGQTVVDLVYNPMETRLLAKARRDGAKPIGGLGMLVHQGVHAFKLFTGKIPPVTFMKKVALQSCLKTSG